MSSMGPEKQVSTAEKLPLLFLPGILLGDPS